MKLPLNDDKKSSPYIVMAKVTILLATFISKNKNLNN